jgi:hypothetical protein
VKYLIEAVGWIAAAMMLSAYILLTTGRLNSNSPWYQWLNVLSGAGFIINSGWNGAYPSAFINVMWMGMPQLDDAEPGGALKSLILWLPGLESNQRPTD